MREVSCEVVGAELVSGIEAEPLEVFRPLRHRRPPLLGETGVPFWGGRNAPYIWMECPNGMGSWDFFDLLLNQIQIIGTPGAGFGACGEGFFRFSTFGDPADTREAAARLLKLLK